MSESHARLSPSNLRWPLCPGSVREEANYTDVAGDAAIDGTGSHLLLEKCITEDVTPNFYEGKIIGANHHDKPSGWLVAQDRIDRVQMALNYINRRRGELVKEYPHGKIKVEAESRSNPGARYDRDDWQGTCDITITVTHVNSPDLILFLEVIDYKDGRGWVHVKDNSQLLAYLGGKLHERVSKSDWKLSDDKPVRTTIVQPKTSPPVRYEDDTVFSVFEQLDALAEAAELTDDPDALLIAGKHCQWCKHKPNCTAQAEKSTEVLMTMSEDVTAQNGSSLFEMLNEVIKDLENITSEKLAELADVRPGIEAIFDRVEKEITSRLEKDPESVSGYAMKPGRSSSAWSISDEEMADVLKARRLKQAEIFPPKLASPAQVMKLDSLSDTQKERLEKEYIIKKEGALKLTRVGKKEVPVESLFEGVAQSTTKEVQSNQSDIPSFM